MTAYTFGQLETLWINAGGPTAVAPLMAAIALAESSGNPNAVNRTDNGGTQTSWGLWQISDGTHSQPVSGILDPSVNAQQAVKKFRTQGLKAWGTYTSGAYRQYMNTSAAPSPVGGTTQISGNAQDVNMWNPLTWGSSAEKGIEEGLTGAFKAIMGPVLQWVWWFSETAVGLVAMGFGVFIIVSQSSAVKGVEGDIKGAVLGKYAPQAKQAVEKEGNKTQSQTGDAERQARAAQRRIKLDEQKRQTAERNDVKKRMNKARRESLSRQGDSDG